MTAMKYATTMTISSHDSLVVVVVVVVVRAADIVVGDVIATANNVGSFKFIAKNKLMQNFNLNV
jgi:hypothetical protein